MDPAAAQACLTERLAPRPLGRWDVRSTLKHFAIVHHAIPPERLRPHIPERFDLATVVIEGQARALVGVVPFLDADFRFPRVAPWLQLAFPQTNHRAYIVDRATGEHAVWFFGTTLGHPIVQVPRHLWRLPWHRARYEVDCLHDQAAGRYKRFRYEASGPWAPTAIELEDTGEPWGLLPGFSDLATQTLVLTHPVAGFYRRRDGALGTYRVWHPELRPTLARPKRIHLGLFERLGLLSPEEAARPHSALIVPEVVFDVALPPKRMSQSERKANAGFDDPV